MNLYLLRLKDPEGYDIAVGHVIAAATPSEARCMAAAKGVHGDEGSDIWRCDAVSVEYLGATKRAAGIVLTDFRAG